MKKKYYLNLAVLLTLGLPGSEICRAQSLATGHITAEVIESASASSQAATNVSLGTSTAGNTSTNTQLVATTMALKLGIMTVSSGNSTTVEVVLKPAKLSDLQGNAFTLNPSFSSHSRTSVDQSVGFQDIIINGTADLAAGQASGLYSGSYTVIFAYN